MKKDWMTKLREKKILFSAILLLLVCAIAIPSFAWFYQRTIAVYAPVSSSESLYIGAGHIEITEEGVFDPDVKLEDVRYLYLNGIDATDDENEYQDFVFCVYGKSITHFKLQLAYTTNNQFSYEIFHATEASVDSAGAVMYVTHDEVSPATYYYSVSGDAISGIYLNKDNEATIANSDQHEATYGEYDLVNTYAEPIYWQSSSSILGEARSAFVHYFILRIHKEDKEVNDRETDVICIAAKSSSS